MYHVECIDIHKDHPLFGYLDRACLCSNNMRNVANFYIRNLMTGLGKDPSARTENEVGVIQTVYIAVPQINAVLREKYELKARNIREDTALSDEERERKLKDLRCAQFSVPDAQHWFASYSLLDAVFKYTDNPDYRSFHSHVIQNAIRDCCESWMSYFKSLSTYSPSSAHTGKPRIPGYKKSGGRSTAVFSNIACSIKHQRLFFPKCEEEGSTSAKRPSLDVSALPRSSKEKLIEVRAVPYYGIYRIQIVTDDGLKEEDFLPKENDIIDSDGRSSGVMMMDLGLENFAAIADNRGNDPIVIKGGALKALNQWSSKRISFLTSELMKGHDTKTYHPPETKQIQSIRRKRDNIMRDTFYKTAHFICRTMRQRGLDYLIVGHSPGAKQGIDIGHKNNQAFVQIPYGKFISILQTVCVKYSVRLILQEESYTSKACFGKRDHIPTYGEDDNRLVSFSGERIKRGVYLQDDGKLINADINAAVNIGRKYDERIFPEDDDCEYLYGTVLSVTVRDVLRASQEYHRTESDPGQTGQRASVCPVSA